MKEHNTKVPAPEEIEKEISEFLSKKFGGNVKVISPTSLPLKDIFKKKAKLVKKKNKIQFTLMPEDLIAYLDRHIVKQANAKAILATKICTHFNRVKCLKSLSNCEDEMVGKIKNNVLMIGPTGVGKTYMIKLIAKKIGVPFVKGDATKFSETGYVGGDVEDLIRDLVKEADDDVQLAQHGIIYIDEVDKIASRHNMVGADISRTGVQRALLKPMEETEIDLKVSHDPISMIEEIERFRKTGKREKFSINTKNILFIMSGAFGDLTEIIKKRITNQSIGFGARIASSDEEADILRHVTSEDLTQFGFESEFVGRLPVKAVFEHLSEDDLFEILKNPNNPIIFGKKLDFAAYGIDVKFEDSALRMLAKQAFKENTGARGLVSAVEMALLLFEKTLPSTKLKQFPVTLSVIEKPEETLEFLISPSNKISVSDIFDNLVFEEKKFIKTYVKANKDNLGKKCNLVLTPKRINTVASFYCRNIMDTENAVKKIKLYYDEVKNLELIFFKNHDIYIVIEEDAVDFIIEQFVNYAKTPKDFYERLTVDFECGFKLIREKTGKSRFFITKKALLEPEAFIDDILENEQNINARP